MEQINPSEFPKRLADAICARPNMNYTTIRNNALRDGQLSAKATGLLCILLSNESGKWISYMTALQNSVSDGVDAIRSGLKELEKAGYLRRYHYVDKVLKRRRGSFWAYTDIPYQFMIDETLESLAEHGLELQGKQIPEPENPEVENPHVGSPHVGDPTLKRTMVKKTKKEEEKRESVRYPTREQEAQLENKLDSGYVHDKEKNGKEKHEDHFIEQYTSADKIIPSMFDEFYRIYPRKEGKNPAIKTWSKLCREKAITRPVFDQVKAVLQIDIASRQWQESIAADKRFIPLPATWLNRRRWEDESAPTQSTTIPAQSLFPTPTSPGPRRLIQEYMQDGTLTKAFIQDCFHPAESLLSNGNGGLNRADQSKLAGKLISLHGQILQAQEQHFTDSLRETLPYYGPMELVGSYVTWIRDSGWIDHPSPNMLDISHSLFSRFKREYARQIDHLARDPLTGQADMRE